MFHIQTTTGPSAVVPRNTERSRLNLQLGEANTVKGTESIRSLIHIDIF